MINPEHFEQLAGAVVCGEATATERAALDAILAAEPALVTELAQVQATDAALRTASLSAAANVVPPLVLARLEVARQEALAARMTFEAKARGPKKVVAFRHETPTTESTPTRPAFAGKWLALAACLALLLGLAAMWMRLGDASPKIAVLAPRGETGFTQPMILWDAEPGQRYDVWILPPEGSHAEAPALFVANAVRPPVAFSDLKPAPALGGQSRPSSRLEPDTDYRLLVCLANAGRVAGVAVPFRTAADAGKALPAPSLEAVKKLAATSRPGDAMMLFLQLPAEERRGSEAQAMERDLRARLVRPSPPITTDAP